MRWGIGVRGARKHTKHKVIRAMGMGPHCCPTRHSSGISEKKKQQNQMGSKGAGVRTVQWTVANVEPSEQIKDASWSANRRGKRSGFYIANCGKRPQQTYPRSYNRADYFDEDGSARRFRESPSVFCCNRDLSREISSALSLFPIR